MIRLAINTLSDLVRRTGDDLLECKNFGVTSLNEVREKLAALGLKLRGEVARIYSHSPESQARVGHRLALACDLSIPRLRFGLVFRRMAAQKRFGAAARLPPQECPRLWRADAVAVTWSRLWCS